MNVATAWRNNGELITDAFKLLFVNGLWCESDLVLDVTYGDGKWWTEFQPERFVALSRRNDPGFDFADTGLLTGSARVVAFDPPYVCKGGRETSTILDMDDAYGLIDAPLTPAALLTMNTGGLSEAMRLATHAVLLKSMDFVSGGELQCHTRLLEAYAESKGWVVFERLVHLPTGGRPQPALSPSGKPRRELRGRQRPSTLSILVPRKYRRGALAKA